MTKRAWALILAGWLGLHFQALADPNQVVVTTEKKHTDGSQVHATKSGSQKEVFELHLQNQTLGDLSQLKVDYRIFIERPKLGAKLDQPSNVDRMSGTRRVDLLTNREPKSVTTDEFTLETKSIHAGYSYLNGGRMKSEDTVVGVWVRVSKDGEVIGEYTSPPTVTKRNWELK